MPNTMPTDLQPVLREGNRFTWNWLLYFRNKDNQLQGEAEWTPTAALADGAVSATTVTVNGAGIKDTALATHDQVGAQNVQITAFPQSANTIRVVLQNKTGAPLTVATGTVYVTVFRRQ